MNNIYIITGPAGVGKSTISKKVTENLEKSVLIEGDTLLKRHALRPEDCQMNEHCLVLLKHFMDYNYQKRFIIDTGKINVDESAKAIIAENRFYL